ncbi:MAG: phosphate ABC transporter substrate-binding protein, partial [Bacteroidales bacterium]|nr:phosphate ABC transporter substrate-binding protein [Bacteroidales bacterium]MDD4001633.1 phosphate ABC transporter substrate-binding protein [Bacteroidales bacterium]
MKNLRKIALVIALGLLVSPFANAQKIKGSDTVLPLSQKEAEAYGKKGGKVTVTGGG